CTPMVMLFPLFRRFFTGPMRMERFSTPVMILGSLEALAFICWWMGWAAASRMRRATGAPAPSASMRLAMPAMSEARPSKPCVSRGTGRHLRLQAPRPLHGELRGGGVVCGLVVALVRFLHHEKTRVVHGGADAVGGIRGIDIAPEIEIHIDAVGRHPVVLMGGLRGGGGVHSVLRRRVLTWAGRAPHTRHDGDADFFEGFLDLSQPLTPLERDAFRPR